MVRKTRSNKKVNDGKKAKENVQKDQNKPPKFKFVCQVCGECCGTESVTITITDLARWAADKTIYRVMHLLKLTDIDGNYKIELKKDDDGKCNLFHRDDKKCTIYDTRPLFCRAFPLGYNGEQYFLKGKYCIGLGKNGMTKEQLKLIRDYAFEEFIANRQSTDVFPIIYSIIFNKLLADSQAFMEQYSEAQKANDLGDLMSKDDSSNGSEKMNSDAKD